MRFPAHEPSLSPAASHLWGWFMDMHQSRQAGLDGDLPLSLSDMEAWQRLTGTIVLREEWAILRAIDAAFISESRQIAAEERDRPAGAQNVAGREMTPALFDALF